MWKSEQSARGSECNAEEESEGNETVSVSQFGRSCEDAYDLLLKLAGQKMPKSFEHVFNSE